MSDLNREIWEGWTPQHFIDWLLPELEMIMRNESAMSTPFTTKEELFRYIVENQPYYKKAIPEVNDYFAKRYGLRS